VTDGFLLASCFRDCSAAAHTPRAVSVSRHREWNGPANAGEKSLSELVNGHNGVSAEMAIRLERAGWGNAETWLGVQLAYDLLHAKQRAGAIKVKRYPVPDVPVLA
jgi:hypothetical protein